jgi:hypothetical protein
MAGSYVLDSKLFNTNSSDWDTLKASFVARGLRVIDPKGGEYAIVRYDRSLSPEGVKDDQKLFRSVVYKKDSASVVCLSPSKSSVLSEAEWPLKATTVQDFVDGVMINVFWHDGSEAQVVTRSRLGADNKFYSELSFLEMLKEAVPDLETLKPFAEQNTQFVSLVLQHSSNRVVTEVKEPRVYVVHAGFVNADGSVRIEENSAAWLPPVQSLAVPSRTVSAESLATLEALTADVQEQASTLGYMWQGYCLKDGDGKRWRIRNKEYSQVKSLRGNESDAVARFCRLRLTRSLKRYLKFYPEDEVTFYNLEGCLRQATRKLLGLYVDTFKFKKQEFNTLVWPYKHHVSVLHNQFKEVLKPQKKTVDLAYVIEYINGLSVEDMTNLYKEPKPKRVQVPTVPTVPSVSA